MKNLYLIGAGNRGKQILEILPYGMIKGVMDSDINKIGTVYESYIVQQFEISVIKKNNFSRVFSFVDNEIINECIKENIDWYISKYEAAWGQQKNIFCNHEVSNAIIQNLLDKIKKDCRLKKNIKNEEYLDIFRNDFFSKYNEELVEIMKTNNLQEVSDKLNKLYSQIEDTNGLLLDEVFENRVGLQLAEKIICNQVQIENKTIKVLDIACGHGELILKLVHQGIDAEGVDISLDRVHYLADRGVKVYNETAERTRLNCEEYDIVVCFECLEHVVNPILVVNEMARVLKENGILLITVPYKKLCDCDTHVRLFDENNISSLLKKKFDVQNLILIPYVWGDYYNNIFLIAKKRGE